eukprot:COSAG01_NODE_25428_length_745_cov_1.421053_1_plen_156_part_01
MWKVARVLLAAMGAPGQTTRARQGATRYPSARRLQLASCPWLRFPCDLNASNYSAAACVANPACTACTFDMTGPPGDGRMCPYVNPLQGTSGASLNNSGGLTTCTSDYIGAGGCHEGNIGQQVRVSCAAVSTSTSLIAHGTLSGGKMRQCCANTAA